MSCEADGGRRRENDFYAQYVWSWCLLPTAPENVIRPSSYCFSPSHRPPSPCDIMRALFSYPSTRLVEFLASSRGRTTEKCSNIAGRQLSRQGTADSDIGLRTSPPRPKAKESKRNKLCPAGRRNPRPRAPAAARRLSPSTPTITTIISRQKAITERSCRPQTAPRPPE